MNPRNPTSLFACAGLAALLLLASFSSSWADGPVVLPPSPTPGLNPPPDPAPTSPPVTTDMPAPAPTEVPTLEPPAPTVALASPKIDVSGFMNVEDLTAANSAYDGGHYDEAIAILQALIVKKGYSAPLCYDLGNALFKSGAIGPAVLQYERARFLAPLGPDIDHNLQLARKAAGLDSDSFTWWQVMIRLISINAWMYLVEAGLALFTLTSVVSTWVVPLLKGAVAKSVRLAVKSIIFFVTPVFLFILVFAALAYGSSLRDLTQAVVVVKTAPLIISPTDGAEKLDVLPEGDLVTVEQSHGDFVQIHARDKKFGWVRKNSVQMVVPES